MISMLENGSIIYENGVKLGEIICDVDGYYYFWFTRTVNRGYWPAHVMRAIADMLDLINEYWDNKVQNDPAIAGSKNPEVDVHPL